MHTGDFGIQGNRSIGSCVVSRRVLSMDIYSINLVSLVTRSTCAKDAMSTVDITLMLLWKGHWESGQRLSLERINHEFHTQAIVADCKASVAECKDEAKKCHAKVEQRDAELVALKTELGTTKAEVACANSALVLFRCLLRTNELIRDRFYAHITSSARRGSCVLCSLHSISLSSSINTQ